MTKRNRSRRRAGGNRSGGSVPQISAVRFHALLTATLSGVTGNFTSILAPRNTNFGVDEICDQFDLYRLSRLRYRVFPMDPTNTVNQAAAWVPDIDVQTVTAAQNAMNPFAAVQTPFCGVPSRWIKIPPASLKGMLDWYKCTADSGATEFEDQGLIIFAGGLSDTMVVEVDGVFDFKNPVNAAVMLERNIERMVRLGKVVRIPQKESPTPVPLSAKFAAHGT